MLNRSKILNVSVPCGCVEITNTIVSSPLSAFQGGFCYPKQSSFRLTFVRLSRAVGLGSAEGLRGWWRLDHVS